MAKECLSQMRLRQKVLTYQRSIHTPLVSHHGGSWNRKLSDYQRAEAVKRRAKAAGVKFGRKPRRWTQEESCGDQ